MALRFRYEMHGRWLKGNTHIHSVASDGGKDRETLARMYAGCGYDFLFCTDHWVASRGEVDPATSLIWLPGIEIDGEDSKGTRYHVVALGEVGGLDREMGFEAALASAREQGALLVLAHPTWMGNTFEEAQRWNPDGVEVYNHVCRWLNGKSCGLAHWNAVLEENPATLSFAVDDAHITEHHPVWNGGWIKVNVPNESPEAILQAIRRGNYYSTCGPDFHSITLEGDIVQVQTSPVRFIRLAGPKWNGQRIGAPEDELLVEASFKVPEGWDYAYIEIEDTEGRRAWSNTLFAE